MLKPYMKHNSKLLYFWKLPSDWWHDISSILLPPLGALNGELPVCCYWLRDVWPEHVHQLRPLLTACKHSVRGHLFPNSTSTNQLPQAHLYHAKLSSRNDVANNSFFFALQAIKDGFLMSPFSYMRANRLQHPSRFFNSRS